MADFGGHFTPETPACDSSRLCCSLPALPSFHSPGAHGRQCSGVRHTCRKYPTARRLVIGSTRQAVTRSAASAVNWMSGDPRLLTPRGDTLTIPADARLDVRLRQKSGHGVAGAVVGLLAGVAVSYAYCPPPKDYCGEEDPTPLLGASLGAVVGSLFKSYPWVQVRRDGPPAAPR